jgi:hypothetical protein
MLKPFDVPKDERICEVLGRIGPAADQRAFCIACIEVAFLRVENNKRNLGGPTPAPQHKAHSDLVKALRKLESALAVDTFWWPHAWPSREELRQWRKTVEEHAGMLGPRKRGRPGETAKKMAVEDARHLVKLFTNEQPSGTRGKIWHEIAILLYDDPTADLFQTIRDYREPELELRDGELKPPSTCSISCA